LLESTTQSFTNPPPDDVAQAGQSAEQGMSLFEPDYVFATYHRARPYYRPMPGWSRMHVNGGAPAIGT
jgi:hypothetical protein